ncbi:GNAT family N-acetyltransferase [Haladaptatus sp. DFWS20]|uniref:GNAT family N-acetyltransferase n=1 Tax=Haladaptatus sp. DFWS20 TaxID=3403467 RepID=UPI003EBECA4E
MADRTYGASTADSYRIRQYEPRDRAGVLALYETVFDNRRGRGDWFDWKFADNPYRSRVPICVAEQDGQVVGARPSLPIPLCVGGARELALVQVDPMVHPDHRRQGLFTRMAKEVYDYYGPREPSIVVGFPNEAVKSGLEKMAETLSLRDGIMSEFTEFHRVQNPRALTDSVLGKVAAPGARGYLASRDWMAPAAPDDETDCYTGVPATLLEEIAACHRTSRVHAVRDEVFFAWRFANPRYDYTTYVFRGKDGPVAIVVGKQLNADANIVHLSDALPVTGGRSRTKAFSALLGRIVADNRNADVIVAAGTTIPRSVLARHGFFGTDRLPLSKLTSAYWFSARPLVKPGTKKTSDERWVVNGQPLAEEERWNLSFCELEIG